MKFLAALIIFGYAAMALFGFAAMTSRMDINMPMDAFAMLAYHAAFFGTLVQSASLIFFGALLLALISCAVFYFVAPRNSIKSMHLKLSIFSCISYLQESLYLFANNALQLLRRWFSRLILSPVLAAQH